MKKWSAMVFTFKAEDDIINQVSKNVPTMGVEGTGYTIASFPVRNDGKSLSWYDWFRTIRAVKKQQKLAMERS